MRGLRKSRKLARENVRRASIRRGVFLLLAALAVSFTLTGIAKPKDPPWVAKDWREWTGKDCVAVLYHSPWVFFYTTDPMQYARDRLIYTREAQLRSALPIRQAELRALQIDKHYDKMNDEQKRAFDQEHVLDLVPSGDSPILLSIYHRTWSAPPVAGSAGWDYVPGPDPGRRAALKLGDGTLVMPTETTTLKENIYENEYLYAFSRVINGKPVLTTNDAEIVFVFGDVLPPADRQNRIAPQRVEDFHVAPDPYGYGYRFHIRDLMYKGKLEY